MQNTQIKYTPQQEQELSQLYQTGVSVKDIAERLGKSERSVIAKLARMGVYQSTKHSTVKRTKGDLVEEISAVLGLESGTLDSLAKAEKLALETLYNEILTLSCHNHTAATAATAATATTTTPTTTAATAATATTTGLISKAPPPKPRFRVKEPPGH